MKSSGRVPRVYPRTLSLADALKRKSVLFLGPRMTGKSTLLRESLPGALTVDLLEPRTFRELSAQPERLEERVRAFVSTTRSPGIPTVVVDEVQKIPELLDLVHRLIEIFPKVRFVLTGSSARRLRRHHVNLLGGRLRPTRLFPLTTHELPGHDYRKLLRWGGLPSVLTSQAPAEELRDYVGTYLREEIQAEGLTRSLGAFSRFLETAAQCNGEQVIFSNVANDCQLPARTVRDHFQVLDDTLVGTLLPAFQGTAVRKAMASAKFFFFDVGVANALVQRWDARAGTPEYGKCLEHLVFCELTAALSYGRSERQLHYWRSLSKFEVDFVIAHGEKAEVAIEVKSSRNVTAKDLRGLTAFAEDVPKARRILVSEESARRTTAEGIEIWPAGEFFRALWADEILP